MKKRKLKNFELKKKTISSLNSSKINGGGAMTFGIICITLTIISECDISADGSCFSQDCSDDSNCDSIP